MKNNHPIIDITGLSHCFGKVQALEQVDLRLAPGELLALLGPNGAGKTTLLSCLLGLLKPQTGHMKLFGHAPGSLAARRATGVMLQNSGVPDLLTVAELVELFRAYHANPLPAERAIDDAGIGELTGRRFGKLSGGQKQQVLFALALVGRPRLLLLDEPTNGMDIEARARLWQTVRQLRDGGVGVLLTTHYLEEADRLADRVVVLRQGRKLIEGAPAQIRNRLGASTIRFRSDLPAARIQALINGANFEANGNSYQLCSTSPARTIRPLLDADPELDELEIQPARLEDALSALSQEQPS